MPLFWRYLLKSYFQVFFLSVLGFIGILLLMRIQEIARLTSLYADIKQVGLFVLLQLPYILSFAIPMSGFISAILLFQRLSSTHEFIAFRASGVGIWTLITPLVIAAGFLSVIHLIVVADLTPRARYHSYTLIQNLALTNPFFLMEKSKQVKPRQSYIDMQITKYRKEAQDMIFAIKNPTNSRLTLILAKELLLKGPLMEAKNVAVISSIKTTQKGYDDLIIENEEKTLTSTHSLASFLQKNPPCIRLEYLPIGTLLKKMSLDSEEKSIKKTQSEIYRRFLFPLNTFALSFLGFSLGMQIERKKKGWKIYAPLLFSALTFFSSITAKSLHLTPYKALFFYILPFPILLFASYWAQRQVIRG